jgi:O-methyltransferase
MTLLSRLRPGRADEDRLQAERDRAVAKLDRHREKADAKIARLEGDLDALRRSYYLSGHRKKLDLRELDGFGRIAAEVIADGRTGMDYDRLYTLWQAVAAAPADLPAIEVGSYRGGSARLIAEALKARGTTPALYVCDTFAGATELDPDVDMADRGDGRWGEATPADTAQYLAGYPAAEVVVGDIAETSARLPDAFGLVHLDVNVYRATAFCLRHFAPRLAPGAIMVLDDYGTVTCPGVKQAADEFAAEFPEFLVWHLLSAQALVLRRG